MVSRDARNNRRREQVMRLVYAPSVQKVVTIRYDPMFTFPCWFIFEPTIVSEYRQELGVA